MKFIVKGFYELSINQLYQILQLRSEVFVVEQNCVYQDIDDKDQKSLHILGIKDTKIVAYTRIFKPGDYYKNASLGRVLIAASERKNSYGHSLMDASIKAIKEYFDSTNITISAQKYLLKFYKSHGFVEVGEEYLEDGIPHMKMLKT